MKTKEIKALERIVQKYQEIETSNSNHHIGGGLTEYKFASRRHEHAKHDESKLTLGEFTAKLKAATGIDTATIKETIRDIVPNMEWHHAGKLPKRFGGGMKKTYFVNAKQIVEVANFFIKLKTITK